MQFRADLHIHTVLSPCGDLNMSPSLIIEKALEKKLDIIGITDHNSTKNALVTRNLGAKKNIFVLMGAEVTSLEEVHCLCFFEDEEKLSLFQHFLDKYINNKKNKPEYFGEQLIVDINENILGEEGLLLIQSINKNLYEISEKVKSLDGIFIPAHVDAHRNSIGSQLGFIPEDLEFDAIELKHTTIESESIKKYRIHTNCRIIHSSDAHHLEDIAKRFTELNIDKLTFTDIKNFLNNTSIS